MRSASVRVRSAATPRLVDNQATVIQLPGATTIVNIGRAIDTLLANDQKILAQQAMILANQQEGATALGAIALSLSNISGQLQAFAEDQVATIGSDVANIIDLQEATIEGLSSLSTEDDAQTIIGLLNTIIHAIGKPAEIGLDLTETAVERQTEPTDPGPSPHPAVAVGLDLEHTATERRPTPPKPGP